MPNVEKPELPELDILKRARAAHVDPIDVAPMRRALEAYKAWEKAAEVGRSVAGVRWAKVQAIASIISLGVSVLALAVAVLALVQAAK